MRTMSKIINRIILMNLIILLTGSVTILSAQNKDYKICSVAFYNLENLFDTIDNENVKDEEFTPDGKRMWTWEKYQKKLNRLADVISDIGSEYVKGGPYVLGVSEIENKGVLEDLIAMPQLKESNYKIVHYDSPDRRGIDVAIIYRSEFFEVIGSRSVNFKLAEELNPYEDEFKSRDQLVVSGKMDGEMMHFIVNHWPSRSGGEKRSLPLRNAAADVTRSIVDSLFAADKKAKIIVMGDLNDDPINASVVKHLKTKPKKEEVENGELYNPMYSKFKKGNGTTAYRDAWSLFDQLIVSKPLLGKDKKTYKYWKALIYKKNYLISKSGRYEGYPLRTFNFDRFQNGYSDHFPVYLFLTKEK